MCETNAYLVEDGTEEVYMETLARVQVKGGMLTLISVFGESKTLNGRIVEINFQSGKVLLERL